MTSAAALATRSLSTGYYALKSPLLQLFSIIGIVAYCRPEAGGALLISSVTAIALSPHRLPKRLINEVALADLCVRDYLSRLFPRLNQTWWHAIEENIILSGLPLKNWHHHEQLYAMGVRNVINLVENDEENQTTFFSEAVKCEDWPADVAIFRLPTPDMEPMTLENIHNGVSLLEKSVKQGKVLVNCKGGRSRSATIVLCYLIKRDGLEVQEAIDKVKAIRPQVTFRPLQLQNLYDYKKSLSAL